MSNSSTVKCPNCKHEFPIGNAMAQEIENEIKELYNQAELEEYCFIKTGFI